MAQTIIKGFVAKEVEIKTVGEKKSKLVRVFIVDDSVKNSNDKGIGYTVDFWGSNADSCLDITKGTKVMAKADNFNNSYEKDGKKIFSVGYRAICPIKVLDDKSATIDLFAEFDAIN